VSKDLPTNEYHVSENFYTYEELKDFTNNFTDRTIINVSAFIKTKTNKEYSVVKRKMLYDLNKQLFENNIAVFDIQKFLNEQWAKTKDNEHTKQLGKDINKFLIKNWAKVTEKNHLIIDRWKEQLKEFE
jgi:hypothetical protein